jgi:ParB/RepB/Spo0J family partition protein
MGEQVTSKAKAKGRKQVQKLANQLERLTVEYVPIDTVCPNEYNPNRQSEHEFKMLLDSMRDNGFTQPIIVQRASMQIVDGEHRWRAARALGYTEIPVVYVEMSPEQMRIATLSHNRARGQEDVELTAELLRDLEKMDALDWAQKSLGLDDVEIQRLITDISAPEALSGSEFSKPWTPTGAPTDNQADIVSMSQEASDKLRVAQKRIEHAKTEQDREAARKDVDIYTVNLIYTGEQAGVIKAVLGNRPAPIILDWCLKAYDKGERFGAKTLN